MHKITSSVELKNAISLLEKKKFDQEIYLKEQFHLVYENLKPANLLKKSFNELTTLPEFKGNIINTAMGIAAGYFSNKLMTGNTRNPLKKIFGLILQLGVTNVVTKNSEGIKSSGLNFIKKIFDKQEKIMEDKE